MKFSSLATALVIATPAAAEIYLKEQFNDDSWTDRWTESTKWKSKSEMGTWKRTTGEFYGDENDTGIQTSDNHRFYGISAALDKPYTSEAGKDLVLQYSVKLENKLDCGGAYIKLLPGGSSFDSAKFGGDAPYGIMFGPDICGASNKRTHVILHSNEKDENLLINKNIPCESNNQTHLYTLLIKSDNTFEVFVDQKSVRSGKLEDEFDFLAAKEILDPDQSKPSDWVDTETIPDPESVKPEGYDDIMPEIPDPDAKKPDDWDDEDDGEWEPPMVDNPDYDGPWTPKMIPNPDYKGPWVHPKIPNPDYKYDDEMFAVCKDSCTHVGFELWQVTAGSIFDDIIVTDSLEEAQKFAQETFFAKKDGEAEMIDAAATEAYEAAKAAEDEEAFLDEMEMGMGDEF